MKINENSSKSTKELKELIKELNFSITKSYGNMETNKVRPEHRKNFRKEIAKIKTILNERKKEEKNERNKI